MRDDLRGLHLHFEPLSGIAGDMTVAALVDLGVPKAVVTKAIAAMGVAGLKVRFESRQRGAYVGTGFDVTWPGMQRAASQRSKKDSESVGDGAQSHSHDGHSHTHGRGHTHTHGHSHTYESGSAAGAHAMVRVGVPALAPSATAHLRLRPVTGRKAPARATARSNHDHRDYADVRRLLRRASLDGETKALAEDIFARIAEVEAALHGMSIDTIAFHEVGAYDSIADIVGASAAIAWLAPASISSVAPVLGTGHVRTAHGLVPVPAPATAALLTGVPVVSEGTGELTTPTGAAILAAVVDRFGPLPPVRLRGQGFGAGTRQLLDRPNMLRVLLGEPIGVALPAPADEALVLQANIDDMNPQLVEPLMSALFTAGALDAWATPIVMKKGRPALEISALLAPDALSAVQRAFFENSTTIGLRIFPVSRRVLPRSLARIVTRFGALSVKAVMLDGRMRSATPEFDDCKRLATKANVPVREVVAAAEAAAAAMLERRPRKRR